MCKDIRIYWHYHHVVPRHAGGTDDKSNLIKVNIPMHAFLHRQRYIETGDEFDRIAADMLGGRTASEQARIAACKEGQRRSDKLGRSKVPITASKDGKMYHFESLTDAAASLDVPMSNMSRALSGRCKKAGGYSFYKT